MIVGCSYISRTEDLSQFRDCVKVEWSFFCKPAVYSSFAGNGCRFKSITFFLCGIDLNDSTPCEY